jgi:hypothetical protein
MYYPYSININISNSKRYFKVIFNWKREKRKEIYFNLNNL